MHLQEMARETILTSYDDSSRLPSVKSTEIGHLHLVAQFSLVTLGVDFIGRLQRKAGVGLTRLCVQK